MGYEIITNEKNVARVKLDIAKEDFDAGIQKAYQKNKNQFKVDGFRKGKVPLKIIESRYGKNIFYEDALEASFPTAYNKFIAEVEWTTCAQPTLIEINEMGDNGAVVTIDVALYPTFELCEYKGIKVGPVKYTFKKSDLDKEISKLRDQQARLVPAEDEAKDGDTVTIDFEGKIDGEPFEGGKSEDYKLVLGSDHFIKGFEEQLVGHKPADKVEINVTFPEDYSMAEFAGKDAVFSTEVKEVHHKELPELDDDFAVDQGYENLEDMNKKLKEKIKTEKNAALKKEAISKITNYLVENTEIDIPPACVEERVASLKEENDNSLRMNGINPDDYYSYLMAQSEENSPEQFYAVFERQAIRDLKSEMIYTKLLEVEQITFTDEQYQGELDKYAKLYGKTMEELRTTESLEAALKPYIEFQLKMNNINEFLLENADKTK